MKSIYIYQRKSHKKKIMVLVIAILIFLILAVKFLLPPVLEAVINRSGSDEKGYSFRIEDLDLKILKGEATVKTIEVFNNKTDHTFLKANKVLVDFDLFKIMGAHKVFFIKADLVDVTISKDFADEVKRVKNEAKEKTPTEVYVEKITANVKKMNVRLMQEDKGRTLMTLNNLHSTIKDLGLGNPKKSTTVHLTSAIQGGGEIELNGKTKLEKDNTPWTFDGQMKNITTPVIEKLAGQDFPFEVEASNFNATITAHSRGEEIVGEISPNLKELKIKVDKDDSFLKRNVAKATNFFAEKVKGENDNYTFDLPFILNENFAVDLEDSWNKFKKK